MAETACPAVCGEDFNGTCALAFNLKSVSKQPCNRQPDSIISQ